MKNRCFLLLFVLAVVLPAFSAESTISPSYRVIHEVDTTWNFGYKGINLVSRKMHRIDIAYPSKDLDGSDIELSGYVCIPNEIYSGEQPCDGILIYNHYTQTGHNQAPTRGYSVGEDMVMANPLKPNYIVVSSDFIGFGISENKLQAFCFNDINGQANIDCFLAARKLLGERNIPQGKFVINAGYSSGGFDAIATQRVRDMKYKDEITIHKTLCGGMPFDIMATYRQFIEWKDSTNIDATCMPMVLGIYNKLAKLGYTNEQMFKEPFASKYDEWFLSGKYTTSEVMDSLKGKKLSELINEPFLDKYSDEYKHLEEVAKQHALSNGWTPDSTQRYFVMHLVRDNVVPVQGGRAFIKFLSSMTYDGKKCAGYKKSIVPERTRLQTNFFIPSENHTLLGGIIFHLNLAATLQATPILFYDDELNTHYADLVEPATLMGIIHLLEEKGFDVRGAVQKLMAESESSSGGGFFEFLSKLDETLKGIGTNTAEMLQILDDSGIELTDILQVYAYLTTPVASARAMSTDEAKQVMSPFITDFYFKQLNDWLIKNNVNLSEEY